MKEPGLNANQVKLGIRHKFYTLYICMHNNKLLIDKKLFI
jgi:hypothetical protein